MQILTLLQHVIEVLIIGSILISPLYRSKKISFLVALVGGFSWVAIRMTLVVLFSDPHPPLIGYVLFPILIFLWMLAVRGLVYLLRKIFRRKEIKHL